MMLPTVPNDELDPNYIAGHLGEAISCVVPDLEAFPRPVPPPTTTSTPFNVPEHCLVIVYCPHSLGRQSRAPANPAAHRKRPGCLLAAMIYERELPITDRLLAALDANSVEQPALDKPMPRLLTYKTLASTQPYDHSSPQNDHPHPTALTSDTFEVSLQSNSLKAQESSCTLSRFYNLYSDEPNIPLLLPNNSEKEPNKNENKDHSNNKCTPHLHHTNEGRHRIHRHRLWHQLPLEESTKSTTPDASDATIADNPAMSSLIAITIPALILSANPHPVPVC
ncbi:unnamed protein product [Cyclocybe aegerita]|uniref:Uncharacterized protein n=1 Tax=Cyclocybe aegerita TaxID=1973307 RepID=A0A8S0WEQ8_CYCAE|nr:unnamed protein product [Cyclocybe aegerita]